VARTETQVETVEDREIAVGDQLWLVSATVERVWDEEPDAIRYQRWGISCEAITVTRASQYDEATGVEGPILTGEAIPVAVHAAAEVALSER